MLRYQTIEPGTLQLLKSRQSMPLFQGLRLVGGTALQLQIGPCADCRTAGGGIGQQGLPVLFPAVRKATADTGKTVLVAAPGTSCRQQIQDGTGVKAFHPIEILYRQLKNT